MERARFICALVFHGLIIAAAVMAIRQDEDGGWRAICYRSLPRCPFESTSMEAEKHRRRKGHHDCTAATDTDDASAPAEAEPRLSQPGRRTCTAGANNRKAEIPEVRLSPSRTSFRRSRRWRNRKSSFRRSFEKKAPLEKAKQEVKKLAAKNMAEHNRDKQKDGKKSGPNPTAKRPARRLPLAESSIPMPSRDRNRRIPHRPARHASRDR